MRIRILLRGASGLLTLLVMGVLSAPAFGQATKPDPKSDGPVLKPASVPAKLPDELRQFHERLSRDLNPTENAVVNFVQLFGVEAFDPPLRAASLDMLGIDRLSESAPRMVYFEPFVKSRGETAAGNVAQQVAQLNGELVTAGSQIWTRVDFPLLHDYLTANQNALDWVLAATRRPRYYAPVLSEEEPPRLLSASVVIQRRLPFLAHLLVARATLRIAEGHADAGLEDLLACHRLAALLAVGSPFDLSAAKAHEIDGLACHTVIALAESGKLPVETAKKYLEHARRLAPLPSPALTADQGERAVLHQEISLLQKDPASMEGFFETSNEEKLAVDRTQWSKLRWDLALQRADEIQDRTVKALSVRDRQSQAEQFTALDRDYDRWQADSDRKLPQFDEWQKKDVEAASRWVGETMAWSLRPWYWQRRVSDDRVRVRRDLAKLCAAIVIFHDAHGEFPGALSELAPRWLPAIPLDAHTDAPFHYERLAKDRARLISWGSNRIDDAGSTYNDDRIIELR